MSKYEVRLEQIPAISAIYFGLMCSGYEYVHIGREAGHDAQLARWSETGAREPFFVQARQNTCEVYSYWPRAALLERAAFHLTKDCSGWADESAYREWVMAAGNLAPQERDEAFWSWVEEFPAALKQILCSDAFGGYLRWEETWIAEQNARHAAWMQQISRTLECCIDQYGSPVRELRLILNPVKCVYSADYHLLGDTFLFTSGRFQAESIIHEFFHHVVHPVVKAYREQIIAVPRRYPGVDDSYYAASQANAFEEYMVRQLTNDALEGRMPDDLHRYLLAHLEAVCT